MPTLLRLAAALSLAVTLAGCGSVSSPSNQATVNFSDTLAPGGSASTNFSVSKTGEMQLTLNSLTPRPVSGFIAVAIGVPSGTSCSPLAGYVILQAAVGQQYSFPQITKGTYCLLVSDASLILTTNVAFSVTLSHP